MISNANDPANVIHPVNVCHAPFAARGPNVSHARPVAATRSPFMTIAIGTNNSCSTCSSYAVPSFAGAGSAWAAAMPAILPGPPA
jgi:hypothetical protein